MMTRMMRITLLLGVLALLYPAAAQARSSQTKSQVHGTVLFHDTAHGQTGNCSCEVQWYTVGLKPGKATVTVTLVSVAMKLGQSYSIHADLERADRTILNQSQEGCWSKTKHCSMVVHFTAHVDKSAAYYIQVQGSGAEGMMFHLQVKGPQYQVK